MLQIDPLCQQTTSSVLNPELLSMIPDTYQIQSGNIDRFSTNI